jgi:hypothetical protein
VHPETIGPNILTTIGEGSLLGLGVLRGKGMAEGGWFWDSERNVAICPINVKALERTEAFLFTVETFEALLGTIDTETNSAIVGSMGTSSSATLKKQTFTHHKRMGVQEKKIIQQKFSAANFKATFILGSGTFGVVTLAEFIPDDHFQRIEGAEGSMFALKTIAKSDIIEMGQLRHVLDESLLLGLMSSNFIVKFYGTLQTINEVVFVTEVLTGGDLWTVMYESDATAHPQGSALPAKLIMFYAASIISALAHVHDKGTTFV